MVLATLWVVEYESHQVLSLFLCTIYSMLFRSWQEDSHSPQPRGSSHDLASLPASSPFPSLSWSKSPQSNYWSPGLYELSHNLLCNLPSLLRSCHTSCGRMCHPLLECLHPGKTGECTCMSLRLLSLYSTHTNVERVVMDWYWVECFMYHKVSPFVTPLSTHILQLHIDWLQKPHMFNEIVLSCIPLSTQFGSRKIKRGEI